VTLTRLTSRLCPITVIPYCRILPFLPPFSSVTSCSTHIDTPDTAILTTLPTPLGSSHSFTFTFAIHPAFSPGHGRRPRVFRCWGRMGRTTFKLYNRNVACPYGNRSVGTSAREPSKLLRRCGGHRCTLICGWIRSRRSTRLSSPKPRCTIRRTELPPSRPSSCSVRRKKLRPSRFYTDAVYVRTSHKRERI